MKSSHQQTLSKNQQTTQQIRHRKTSADIINEAKNMLTGGTRLVSTRRPNTPKEPRRQLYGKQAPPGRPPSSFSLRYLQFESRSLSSVLPSLDKAIATTAESNRLSTTDLDISPTSSAFKLPALLLPPRKTGPIDDLSEEMPPRSDTDEAVGLLLSSAAVDKKNVDTIINGDGENAMEAPNQMNVSNLNAKRNFSKMMRNNDLLTQSNTSTLLDLLKAHAGITECSDETVLHINGILSELYTRVKGARGQWRGAVLSSLYGLVECTSPKILLSVARVVLVLCVTGSNLTGACKLVFKVARSETNDMLFVDSDVPELLIDGLGRANPIEEPDACIYGYGAVRFLANATVAPVKENGKPSEGSSAKSRQKTIAHRLARHGAVQLMVLHLQLLNESGATQKLTGPPLHAMYQLTSALRVLSKTTRSLAKPEIGPPSLYSGANETTCPQIHEVFEQQDVTLNIACPHLVRAAEICIDENEVQSNVIRTLSVLSEQECCCMELAEYSSRLGMLIGPCAEELSQKPLGFLIRLGYILGNIMAQYDEARSQFFNNDVAMEYLINTLEYYSKTNLLLNNNSADSAIEVLIKLIRVVANMSVNNEVGYGLGIRQSLGNVLLTLISSNNAVYDQEELLLATLGALHNLSFFQDDGAQDTKEVRLYASCMTSRLSDLSTVLCSTLQTGSPAVRIEAARVLGNMTRNPVARNAFCLAGGLKVLVKNLETDDNELVSTSCGVLVNILSEWERRAPFRELRGPYMLRDVLQRGAMSRDWFLAATVCQALWNFLIDTANIIGALGEDEADYIAGDLAEYLDEENLFKGTRPEQSWERFAVVAADLLERIQSSITYSVSPCASSEDEDQTSKQIGTLWQGHFQSWLQE